MSLSQSRFGTSGLFTPGQLMSCENNLTCETVLILLWKVHWTPIFNTQIWNHLFSFPSLATSCSSRITLILKVVQEDSTGYIAGTQHNQESTDSVMSASELADDSSLHNLMVIMDPVGLHQQDPPECAEMSQRSLNVF